MKKPERKIVKQRVKEYRNLARKIYDWDYCYALEVEKLQLRRMYEYLEKENLYEGVENDVRWMKLAYKILSMYINQTWWSIDFSVKPKKYITPYVNTRNAKRFFKHWNNNDEFYNRDCMKVDVYEQKLWNLYHKIRYN